MWWARWSIWIVLSAILTSLVVGNAFYQKKQFYPTVVFITKSKPSMAVVYAQALLFVVIMGKLFRKVFFGTLRAAEFEHLVERSWYAVTETCLAFTVFRDDFSPKFLALFTFLLFLKSFHWLAEERVDYMERSPVITWVFHVRVLSLLSLLLSLDLYFVNVAYQSTLTKGASVQLVFGFEYAILATIVLNILAKYLFHLIDMQNEQAWENKAVFVLYTEVVIGLFKVILYLLFLIIMVRIYTLPLFALRPTYLALRAFKKALNDIIMSRRAINNMNNLYPDATAEELATTDNVCIICREEFEANSGAKKLPCNHIFHVSCLRSWFQRQQTCPTCRLNVLRVPAPPTVHQAAAAAQARNLNNFPGFMNQFPAGFDQAQMFRQGQMPPQFGMGMWGQQMQIPPWAQQQQQQQQQQNIPQQQQPAAGAGQQNQASPSTTTTTTTTEGNQQENNVTNPAGNEQSANTSQPGTSQNPSGSSTTPAADPNSTSTTNGARPPNPNPNQFNFSPFQFPPYGMGMPPQPPPGTTPNPFTCPFPFPPMPFLPFIPPPPPPVNITGLSDEDLRLMEGTARENIEARLNHLRNIQILIDSAVVQMQQYTNIVANTTNTTIPRPSTENSTSTPTPAATGESSSNNIRQRVVGGEAERAI